jgi:hypothetical protein
MMSLTTSPRASSNRRPVVMNPQGTQRPVGAVRGESDRVRLAGVALTAALGVPGVLAAQTDPLGTRVTETSAGERLEGVSCVAAPGVGYDVLLRLICGLVALQPLGERIRAAVMRAAAIAGITVQSVSVYFAELAVEGDLR